MNLTRGGWIMGALLLVTVGAAALALGGDWGLADFGALSQILAFLAAAGFFGYRVLSGFFVTNVSLRVECVRTRKNANIDFLAVRVTVEKGDQGVLHVHDARVHVTPASGAEQERSLLVVERAVHRRDPLSAVIGAERNLPATSGTMPDGEVLQLNPGEKTELSTFFEIARDTPCSVEALLFGRKPSHRAMGRWRASATALPLLGDAREHPAAH